MELDKTVALPLPPAAVWPLLLDPQAMAACMPGMQSVEVVGPAEYRAKLRVKIAFVAANFAIRTTVVEQRAPNYLRTEGSGEDAAVASSFRQFSEIFVDEAAGGGSALRIKLRVELLGRLGSLGLNVMKTKADRMWDEFAARLAERLTGPAADAAPPLAVAAEAAAPMPPGVQRRVVAAPPMRWWQRLFAARGARDTIVVTVQRGDLRVEVRWPSRDAGACAAWLDGVVGPRRAP